MTPTTETQIDPVSVITAIIGIVISSELSRYVAPYIVISAAGVVGSAFALARADPAPGLRWVGYVAWYTAMSLLLTVPIALWLQSWSGLEVRWLLAPVSGMVAAIGHDWPKIGRWVLELIARLLERKTGESQ